MTSTGSEPHVGIVAVGRPTFDLDLARTVARAAADVLTGIDPDLEGSPEPVIDPEGIAPLIAAWPTRPDLIVVLQATFTDATFVAAVADAAPGTDLLLWSFPEPRTGDRLRLNSLCGLNLAGYRVASTGAVARWAHLDPTGPDASERIAAVIAAPPHDRPPIASPEPPSAFGEPARAIARDVVTRLGRARLGLVGEPPAGFDPYTYTTSSSRCSLTKPAFPRARCEPILSVLHPHIGFMPFDR